VGSPRSPGEMVKRKRSITKIADTEMTEVSS
jgi:hypothetical protein